EDQYIWSPHVIGVFADALTANPDLRLIAVVPHFPDRDSARYNAPQLYAPPPANPDLRRIGCVPHFPDRDSARYNAPQLYARTQALDQLRRAGGDRVAVYGVGNAAGTPVYVHAKVCIVDDVWTAVGSDNINLRSWTFDSELSCAVLDESPDGQGFARRLRLGL